MAALFFLLLMAAPLGAAERPPAVVGDEVREWKHGPILGARPAAGPAHADDCRANVGCDVIPLVVETATATDVDTIATITVAWDADDGNILDATLFKAGTPPKSAEQPEDVWPGLVAHGNGQPDGVVVLHAANLSPGNYELTVANMTGVNRGYTLTTARTAHAWSTPSVAAPGLPPPAGRSGGPGEAVVPAPVPEAPREDPRGPDERFHAAVGAASETIPASTLVDLPVMLVVTALCLLILAAVAAWRVKRTGSLLPASFRYRDVRLFWKLMTPFVVVILVVGAAGVFLTARYVRERAELELTQRLVQGSSAAAGYVRDQEFALLDAVRFAANVEGLPAAVAAGDAVAIEERLASVMAVNVNLDVIAAVAPDGRSLATLSRDDGALERHAGEVWARATPVARALAGEIDAAGDKHAGFLRLTDGGAVLVVASPVRGDGVIGAVVVGRRAGGVAAEAARRADAAVGFYDGSGAQLAASESSAPDRVEVPGEAAIRQQEGRDGERSRLVGPLRLRDRTIGAISVSVPAGDVYGSMRAAAIRMGLLVAAGVAAIVAIGVYLSQHILGAIRPLLATNRRLGAGDLGARAPVHGADELGELAAGFNQMATQLEASYQQLERRVAERTEELQRLYQELHAASQAKQEFFASVSHEFRSPLFAILASSECLIDDEFAPQDPVEQREYLTTIHVSARQLVSRVNEILELARTESAEVTLRRGPVDATEVLVEVAACIDALARRGELVVRCESPRRLPLIDADRDRLVQILLNLGSNAVKYTPAGGTVVVRARDGGNGVVFEVSDTGIGIPSDVGDRIFEPYYMVDHARTSGQPSTGLGLAVAKRLVEAHGGLISYESRPGEGTTFAVTIPTQAGRVVATTGVSR